MPRIYQILYFFLLWPAIYACGQEPAPSLYYTFVNRADSFLSARDYKNAAHCYSSAFEAFGWKGFANDRYSAASAWAMAGVPDSAFFNLFRIAEKANFSDYNKLISDENFVLLHDDSLWQPLLQSVLENKERSEPCYNKPLLHLINRLADEDQKWRNYMRRFNNNQLPERERKIPFAKISQNIAITDERNYERIRKIVKEYGYPGFDLIGKEGSQNFWRLVQHQDKHPHFQNQVLKKMKKQVDSQKASATDYAYLLDRVKVNLHQLQVYGTQMTLNADSSSYIPKPTIDPETLNERRNSMGLTTIENYTKVMNTTYFGTLKKKR